MMRLNRRAATPESNEAENGEPQLQNKSRLKTENHNFIIKGVKYLLEELKEDHP